MPIAEMLPGGARGWRRWAFAGASVAAHAAVVTALVVGTNEADASPAQATEAEKVTYVDIRSFAPPPPPPPAARPEPQPNRPTRPQPRTPQPQPQPQATPEPRVPARPSDIVEPTDSVELDPLGADLPPVPEVVPEVVPSPPAAPTGGQPGGEEGGKPGGVEGGQGEAVPEAGGTYVAAVVDRKAELKNRGDLPRIMERLFPDAMRAQGRDGRVVVQFVVDERGRVDAGTVKVMSSTSEAFEEATREALKEFRFTPATIGDHPVRMLTQIPVIWEIQS